MSGLLGIACLVAMSVCSLGGIAQAQSTDIAAPSAVRTNEVLGTIAARDIGDPRLTDHFYAFTGRPGDLLITVDSKNINGDIDVFTTTGLRPLLKLTVYASNTSPATKSIYLRKQESLILRIEGRTPNDDEGIYRLYFGGSFEPTNTETFVAENESTSNVPETPGAKSGKKGRRVSSVGARIDEPPPAEVAVAPAPEPTPAEIAKPEEAKPEATKIEASPGEVTKTEATKPPARTVRGRRPPGRRTPAPARAKEEVAKTVTENASETPETAAKPAPAAKRSTRKGTTTAAVKPAPVEPEPESGPRLVIETNDGTMINRYMSSVRRVVVENGQVVVTGKDGKIERVPLATVVRMSIAP